MFRVYFLSIVLLIVGSSLFSQVTGGNKTLTFLNSPISARATAMGGNAISLADGDISMVILNPAILSDTMNMNMSVNYINYIADINYGYVAFAKNIQPNHNLFFGIHYLDYGKFISADQYGNISGTFSANDISMNVSYATTLNKVDSNFSIGATLKTIYSNLNNYSSWASAIDIGGLYVFPKYQLNVSAVIKNTGVQWKNYTSGNREKLPFEMQLGCSKRMKHAPLRISLVYENLEKWNLTTDTIPSDTAKFKTKEFGDKLMRHVVIGGELILSKNFFIRLGFDYQRRKELMVASRKGLSGFSFGFGVHVYKFNLSYGRAMYSLSGASNNFSLTFDLNSFHRKKTLSLVQ